MKKTLTILFLFALFFCLPFLLTISSTFPRLDTDYDAVLPIYQYIGMYFRMFHVLPSGIPFVAGGIPLIGDPASGILNPLFLIPLLIFNINISIRITFVLVIFCSGISMFLFLRSLRLSQFLQYWGAFLYMSSGIITACISAGHISEKFLSIPLTPLLLLLVSNKTLSWKRMIFLGIVIAETIYSGDFYGAWFFFLMLFCTELFYFSKDLKTRWIRIVSLGGVCVIFLLLTLPFLVQFLLHVYPIMRRPTYVSPFLGSVHAILFPLQFLIPFQVNFYDRPFFQRHLGFYYNWYEYYGFLGLFPILFFKNIGKAFKDTKVQLFLFLLLVGSLYLSSKYFYSPFHWIYIFWKGSNVFRVPQRIVIPLTPVVVALFCILASKWKNNITLYAIALASIIWTVGVGWFTFSYTFVPPAQDAKIFVEKFAQIDKSRNEIANFVPSIQYFLIQKGIPIHNYYYAWVPKTTMPIDTHEGDIYKNAILQAKIPFILSTDKKTFNDIGYSKELVYKNYVVWSKQ